MTTGEVVGAPHEGIRQKSLGCSLRSQNQPGFIRCERWHLHLFYRPRDGG